ncbi:MAG: aconitate hydratase AcnA, partial [Candidatus Micrarchaeota archaeon]|nr:aconitate hydratase AcnA [Candidatus Micrarchaeota archaeon]
MAGDIKALSFSSFVTQGGRKIQFYSLPALEKAGFTKISKLPFSIRVVLESLIRNLDGKEITGEDVEALANWNAKDPSDSEIPFKVSRILMQDFTGVPAVVDIAAMRDYAISLNKPAGSVKLTIPVDLIIDHSVQVDAFNIIQAFEINQKLEMERNMERYKLLKWASMAFDRFRVLPPSAGICHQVNLEYIATCVSLLQEEGNTIAIPDTLVGTDSHTTMINGLGIVGFGVGGIEAEAALLGQPVGLTTPKVLGVRLSGKLRDGITATDFALTLTKILRDKGVVNMFVEFFGEGVASLSLPDRATLSNMCPEYGATIAIFPVDDETLRYMEMTGRDKDQIELVKRYYQEQGMFAIDYDNIEYSEVLRVDLGSIVPCVSGPSQPKQEIPLDSIRQNFINAYMKQQEPGNGHKLSSDDYTRWSSEGMAADNGTIKNSPAGGAQKKVHIRYDDGYETDLADGDVVISSITSCTNTSNPSVMLGAGILAKKALERGLRVDTRKVKTSLGPGSRVVTRYLEKAGLMESLNRLGYGLVGYGCITCIGNSGPLIDKQSDAINANNLAVVSVLSGNRNYEARIHRDVRANYLMSPPLLIAFALAGNVLKDLTKEPLGKDNQGKEVYLKDIWPTKDEINTAMSVVNRNMFKEEYSKSI